ncbi:hypothetical protein GIX45_08285 [Erwinia sp. CPCC 100877]|nr:hypothetical protein [Erwinia sp. CPCC 100877]
MNKLYLFLALLFVTPSVAHVETQTEGTVGLSANQNAKPILNPENPAEPITVIDNLNNTEKTSYGEDGVLTIDYVSNFQFGLQHASDETTVISASDQQAVTAEKITLTIPNFIQVSDTRGTNSGWKLSVKQCSQFHTDDQQYPELTGAILQLNNGKYTSPVDNTLWVKDAADLAIGQEEIVMRAAAGEGGNSNLLSWTNGGISLIIPGNSPKLAQTYQSELQWSILDTP